MENLPVPHGPHPVAMTKQGAPLVPKAWGMPTVLPDFTTSLDVSTDRGKRLVEKCLNGESESGKECINLELSLVDFLIKPNESPNEETGEVTRYVQTFLICEGDRIVRFSSNGVIKSLSVLCVTRRSAPWDPPLRVLVKDKNIGNGRQYYSLLPVDERPKSVKEG